MRNFCLFFLPIAAAVAAFLFVLISHLNNAVAKRSSQGPYSLIGLQAGDLADLSDY
jgi:hypothetical protein